LKSSKRSDAPNPDNAANLRRERLRHRSDGADGTGKTHDLQIYPKRRVSRAREAEQADIPLKPQLPDRDEVRNGDGAKV